MSCEYHDKDTSCYFCNDWIKIRRKYFKKRFDAAVKYSWEKNREKMYGNIMMPTPLYKYFKEKTN